MQSFSPLSRPGQQGWPVSRALAVMVLYFLAGALAPGRACGAQTGQTEPRRAGVSQSADDRWLAPVSMVIGEDGKTLYLACAAAKRIDVFDLALGRALRSYDLRVRPSGLALARGHLYVTCAAAESVICDIHPGDGKIASVSRTGHTALSPVVSVDGKTLFVCLKFNHEVLLWDTVSKREQARVKVGREPVSVAPTPDGNFLLVAHHLPAGAATAPPVAASVGVIDLRSRTMIRELPLVNGSGLLRQIRISPDGRYAALSHNLARFHVPTTQLDRGWMNTSALTLLDVEKQTVLDAVLLDEVDRGAANPWAVGWSKDGNRLLVSHAGTHELSVIDFPALLRKLAAAQSNKEAIPPSDDLSFMVGIRERKRLSGNGPRSLAVNGDRVYLGGYFSDTIDIIELAAPVSAANVLKLNPAGRASLEAEGERLFNDASICFQGWQSCGSCHSDDARVDGFNWDLLNDGIGNPKNTRSLLLSHQTPPAMSTGVRFSAEEAVRAGLQHILFTVPSPELSNPLDVWLKSLKPMPSPRLVSGKLSDAAKRGEKLFKSAQTQCSSCHKPGLFTDLSSYDVGTAGPYDRGTGQFDTPTLIELWRTAPYLHDGSAVTLQEVLTSRNRGDLHGRTSHLSQKELNDLAEFLLSL